MNPDIELRIYTEQNGENCRLSVINRLMSLKTENAKVAIVVKKINKQVFIAAS